MGQDNCRPQPGDLIEIFRPLYQHWALYVGDGYVIHVTDEGASSISLSSSSIRATRGKVKKELLEDVVKNCRWRVNNKYDRSRTPFPVEKIIQRAEQCVGREVPYDVVNGNCEHFVTMLRYGEGKSQQVDSAGGLAATVGAMFLPGGSLIAMIFSKDKSGDSATDGLSGRAQTKVGKAPGHSSRRSAFAAPAIKASLQPRHPCCKQ